MTDHPSNQYISLEMLDLSKQHDALQISSMFPKFQMHVIVQELILNDFDVNSTIDTLLNKKDEIIDNRASSSSNRSSQQVPRPISPYDDPAQNIASPPSYEDTVKQQQSKNSNKKPSKRISSKNKSSEQKSSRQKSSNKDKNFNFTTVNNKKLLLLPLPDDFLRIKPTSSSSSTNSTMNILVPPPNITVTDNSTIDSPTHFRLSDVQTGIVNNISSNSNNSNQCHACNSNCIHSHRYAPLPTPESKQSQNEKNPVPLPLPRDPCTPSTSNTNNSSSTTARTKPELPNSKNSGWQRFD